MGPIAAQFVSGRLGLVVATLVTLAALGLISPPPVRPVEAGSLRNPHPLDTPPGDWPLEPLYVHYRPPEAPAAPVAGEPARAVRRALDDLKTLIIDVHRVIPATLRAVGGWVARLLVAAGPQDKAPPRPGPDDTAGPGVPIPDRFDDLFQNGWIYGPSLISPRAGTDDHPPLPGPRPRPMSERAGDAIAAAAAFGRPAAVATPPPTLAVYSDIVLGTYHMQAATAEPRSRVPRQRHAGGSAAWAASMPAIIQATAVLFLSAVILVPAGCSFTAGALYAHPRDGPHAPCCAAWGAAARPGGEARSYPSPSCRRTSCHTSTPTAIMPINVSTV